MMLLQRDYPKEIICKPHQKNVKQTLTLPQPEFYFG